MRYIFLLTVCLAVSASSFAQADSSHRYKEALRLVDAWLEGQRDFDKLPGISVAILKDQEVIYKKGFGVTDLQKKTPASSQTVYSICSISKLFTAIAIMKLWEEGKLRLDDSIAALLPSYNLKQQYAESTPVTIRSLLTHSSGLPREAEYPYWSDNFTFPTAQQVAKKLGTQQTLYPASTYWQYSNLGITLLGDVVARVSGQPYEKYIEDNILKPLRLADTRTYLPKELWGTKLATGYSAVHRDGSRIAQPLFNAAGITAAAGFSSTVEDLARFAAWQFRLLQKGGKEIIKASTLREMHRVNWLDPDWKLGWGLGFSVFQESGNTYVGHGGSCPGYVSLLEMDPKEKLAVAVMINGQGVPTDKYTTAIFSILQKAKVGKEKTDTVNLEPYAGYYDSYAWRGETVVVPWQGGLAMFTLPSTNPATGLTLFKPVGKDLFRRVRSDGSLGEDLRFERDTSGKVLRLWRHSNPSHRMVKQL